MTVLRGLWAASLVAVVVLWLVRPAGTDADGWVAGAAVILIVLALVIACIDVLRLVRLPGVGAERGARGPARHASGRFSTSPFATREGRRQVLADIASGRPAHDPQLRDLEVDVAQGLARGPQTTWQSVLVQCLIGWFLLRNGVPVIGWASIALAAAGVGVIGWKTRRQRQAEDFLKAL